MQIQYVQSLGLDGGGSSQYKIQMPSHIGPTLDEKTGASSKLRNIYWSVKDKLPAFHTPLYKCY